MKNQILSVLTVIVLMGCLSFAFKSEDEGLAKVKSIEGHEIYIMCEPVKNYSLVDQINSAGNSLSMMTIEKYVSAYMNKAEKKGIKYDAIIFHNNWSASFIKWK